MVDAYYLLVDAGNSLCKYSLFDCNDTFCFSGSFAYSDKLIIDDNLVKLNIKFIFICSVKNSTFINKFKNLCLSRWETSFTIFDSSSYDILSSHYTPFSSLGVDRWVSILGLSLKGNRSFCVIDCGTAITVDYVIDNIHLGGLISPGLHTFSKSLNTSTDNINSHINDLKTNLINYTSTSTSECISSASTLLFKAFLENILAENKKNYGDGFVTYMSGGYSHLFNNNANYNIIFCKNLILDGLFEVKKTFLT